MKQAAPDLYVIVSHYHADGDTVIPAMRAGANEFLLQPLKRTEFRDAVARFERAPKRTGTVESKLGKIYTFLGAKGGVGTTSLAVNFAAVLAQRKRIRCWWISTGPPTMSPCRWAPRRNTRWRKWPRT